MRIAVSATIAVAAMLGAIAPASAALVGFEGIVPSNGFSLVSALTTQGYTFTAGLGQLGIIGRGNVCNNTCADSGSATLIYGAPANTNPFSVPPLTLTGAAPFNFASFDYAELATFAGNNATQLLLTGNLLGGGTLSRTFILDGIVDGAGGLPDFQSAVLDRVFATAALTSVTFSGFNADFAPKGFSLDNLVLTPVAAVPEPATWAMLVGGIGMIGGTLRRRRHAVRTSVRFA